MGPSKVRQVLRIAPVGAPAEPAGTGGSASSGHEPVVAPLIDKFPLPEGQVCPPGIFKGCRVDTMRSWLQENGCPQYGAKEELYKRICERYKVVLRDEALDRELMRRVEEARAGQPQKPVVPLPTSKMPTAVEREEHELTHARFQPWCEYCVLGKGTTVAHRVAEPDSRERIGPRCEFDFAHMKADGTYIEEGAEFEYSDIFCTHLVGVDMGNGRLFCTSMDLKGNADTNQAKYNVEAYVC